MKKIFTLFAAALMAVGVQAQKITFVAGQTPTDGFVSGDFRITVVDTDGKMAVDANSQYFGTVEAYENYSARLKTGAKSSEKNSITLSVPADGLLKIAARSASGSATDRNLVVSQNGKELYNKVVQDADAAKAIIEEVEKSVFPVIAVTVKAGTIELGYPVGSLNFYAFEFLEGESGGETPDPNPDPQPVVSSGIDYPTSEAGITISGTTVKGTVKIHENTDAVECITLKNGYLTEEKMNGNHILLEVEGGFKTGDVVTIGGAINNSDTAKRGTADLFVTADGETTTSLNVFEDFINGRLVADDIVPQTYTLEADYDKLYIGRNGNTGTNLTIIKVTRGGSDNILSVKTSIVENGVVYNLAGQKVAKNFKGLVIENGKKVIKK